MDISLDWYKIFYRVADKGNITAAADYLHISQPAVSQTIRQLEEALGCALFVRTPKGVSLTAEGASFYEYVSQGIGLFESGERHLELLVHLDAGEIQIGASDMTLQYCLLLYIGDYCKCHPGIKINITNQPTPQTVTLLAQKKIDFGVVSEPIPPAHEEFDIIPVCDIHDIFICNKSYASQSSLNRRSISDLPPDELILLEEKTSTRRFLNDEFSKRGFRAAPRFELATSVLIVEFAKRGLGIGCVVSNFAEDALNSGEVVPVLVSDPLPSRKVCIIKRKTYDSRATEALIQMIRDRQ